MANEHLKESTQTASRMIGRKATPITPDGDTVDSVAAARRYGELKADLMASEIEQLRVRPVYDLRANGVRPRLGSAQIALSS